LEWRLYAAPGHGPAQQPSETPMLDLIYITLGFVIFAAFAVGARAAERI
jgi:hypothetical protein